MEKIENVELAQLVKEASMNLISKRKDDAIALVTKLIFRIEGLVKEKRQAEVKVRECEGKIASSQDKLNKIKNGDWSILDSLEKESSVKADNSKDVRLSDN